MFFAALRTLQHIDLGLLEAAHHFQQEELRSHRDQPQVTTSVMSVGAHRFCKHPFKALHLCPAKCTF